MVTGRLPLRLKVFRQAFLENGCIFSEDALKYPIFNEKCHLAPKFDGSSQKATTWYGKIGRFIFFLPQLTSTDLKYYCLFCILYPTDTFQDHIT